MIDKLWEKIANTYKIHNHNFNKSAFLITANQIKDATKNFSRTNEREVRILCKQDTREDRPKIFKDHDLFLLPTKNGEYAIVKGGRLR